MTTENSLSGQVLVLIRPFWNLCLLRANPQDLPLSSALMTLAVSAYFVAGWLLAGAIYGFGLSLFQTGADLLILSLYTYSLLQISGYRQRFTQTLTALTGAGAIVTLVAIPLSSAILRSVSQGESVNLLVGLGYLLLMGWLLVVYAHIYRHALSRGLPFGLLVSLGYVILGSLVTDLIASTP